MSLDPSIARGKQFITIYQFIIVLAIGNLALWINSQAGSWLGTASEQIFKLPAVLNSISRTLGHLLSNTSSTYRSNTNLSHSTCTQGLGKQLWYDVQINPCIPVPLLIQGVHEKSNTLSQLVSKWNILQMWNRNRPRLEMDSVTIGFAWWLLQTATSHLETSRLSTALLSGDGEDKANDFPLSENV